MNILGLKSDFDFFRVADYASGRKISFLLVGVFLMIKFLFFLMNKSGIGLNIP